MKAAGRFRRRVLGPLLMEMVPVQNPVWAAQLEYIVGKANLGMVVCEDMEDNNMIQTWVQQQQRQRRGGCKANKLLFLKDDGAPPPQGYPQGHASQYSAYDITHTVDQLFEATSELVKDALRLTSSIHTAYVGTDRTLQAGLLNQLLSRTPIRRVLSPRVVATSGASEYNSSHKWTKLTDLPRAQLLNEDAVQDQGGAGAQQLAALRQAKSSAEAEAQRLAASLNRHKAQEAALQQEKTQLQNERRRLEKSAADLARRERDLAAQLARREAAGDPLATAGALRGALVADAEEMLRLAETARQLIAAQHQHLRRQAVSELSLAAASNGLAPLQQAVRRAEAGLAAVEGEAAGAARLVQRAQEKLRQDEERLREELGGGGAEPDAALRAAWAEWPEDSGALQQLMAEKEAEMEAAQASLRGDEVVVMEAWKRREGEISRLREEAAAGSSQVAAAEADVENRKSAWLPELHRHMESINGAVKGHFAAIGCAGEVVLREAGDAFGEYAAEIRVQYRPNEPLRPLNRNHHSGGERSVATMLYLMALQGVTTTPFRVVDEINQGMDSNNERKVFNLLVECSSHPDTPQCFLLTPKLIANLRFNDHVRVMSLKWAPAGALCVMPSVAAQLAEEAEAQAGGGGGRGGGGGGAAAAPSRPRQPRAGAAPMLAQLPWQQMKGLLLYGRAATAGEG
ncbi:hypothetical protein PLESTM_000205100 [Pleodorina starrii]|nr:hypothetical protein PLESTM_000205100 [Pleodorina starrii]